jgi:hypothetical protein
MVPRLSLILMAVASLTIAKADPQSDAYAVVNVTLKQEPYHHIVQFHLKDGQDIKTIEFINVTCNGHSVEGLNTVLEKGNLYVTFCYDDFEPEAKWHWDTKPSIVQSNR